MDNLYLANGESISLTTQNIIVDGIRHEVILTNRRLILLRSDAPQPSPREIPLATISSAIAGENPLREPTITIVVTDPDGVLQTVKLVFIRQVSEQKNPQFNEWVKRLKDSIKITIQEPDVPHPGGSSPGGLPREKVHPHDLPTSPVQQDHGSVPQDPDYVFRPPKPAVPPDATAPTSSKILTLVVFIAVIVIAVLISAQFLIPKVPPGTTAGGTPTVSPPAGTVSMTAHETPVPPTAEVTVQESVAPPAGGAQLVPPSGVWVRVQYSGNYIGSVGTQGRLREINTTGDHFFQIPAKNDVIIADIQKTDASGNPISVEIYSDGTLVKRADSTSPNANLLLNVGV